MQELNELYVFINLGFKKLGNTVNNEFYVLVNFGPQNIRRQDFKALFASYRFGVSFSALCPVKGEVCLRSLEGSVSEWWTPF